MPQLWVRLCRRPGGRAALIGNPLTFKPGDLTVPTAMEIGGGWSKLSTEERRQFTKYYGLWCA